MTHQQALDNLIRDIAPSPYLEQHIPWLKQNTAFLTRRIERVKNVKRHLDAKEILTAKEKRFQNRYRGKILRLTTVQQHREYLLMIALLRVKQSKQHR